jgi:hypothetical protein
MDIQSNGWRLSPDGGAGDDDRRVRRGLLRGDAAAAGKRFRAKELLRSIRVLCRTLFGSDYVGLLAKAAEIAVLALRAPSTSRSGG